MSVATFAGDLTPLVRHLLGDTDVAGGDLFTDGEIHPSFISAWDELISMMAADQIPAAKRIWYHILPAYTTILYPSQAGINDLDSLVRLRERTAVTQIAITACISGTGGAIQITTASPHGFASNQLTQVMDLQGVRGANGQWYATVVDPSNLLLKGSMFPSDAAYVASTGAVEPANANQFLPVHRREDLPQRDPDTALIEFAWREDNLQFIGATVDAQLEITYLSDGTAPSLTGSLIYDGIQNALAYRTAALLAYKHGRGQDDGARLDRDARGDDLDGHGGHYYTFLQRKIREMQKDRLQRPVEPPAHLTEIYYPTS